MEILKKEEKQCCIKLTDYAKRTKEVNIDLTDVVCIIYQEITGDDVLKVIKNDGTIDEINSCHTRCRDFYDDEYVVYVNGKWIEKIEEEY